jgi:hypothetical protein
MTGEEVIMKKAAIGLILVMAFTTQVFAQAGAKEKDAGAQKQEEEDKSIGLSFGIDYYSKYIWRGIDFYQGDGYFYPSISWEVFGSGLTLKAAAEISSSWVFNGFTKRPKKYYFEDYDWALESLYRKKKQVNAYAYANHGLDFGAEYSYTFENIITLGANFWYYWYYNSKYAREMAWPKVESLNIVKKWDTSYFSVGANIGLDCVPWINPTIAVFYDNYVGYKRAGDYYLQLGFSHEFVLVKDVVSITPSITAGYYWGRTYGYNNWYIASLYGVDFNITPVSAGGDDLIWRQHQAPKKGVSDVVPSVTMTVTHNGFTFTSGFFYVIVPAKSWYKGGPIHKFYAQLGLAYAI